MAGNRWRYEHYSFDFAIGAILFSLISAYTLGAFGSDLGFAENLMLSSKTNQALAFVGGGLFALGNSLLLCAISLIGLSFSYPIATAAAILVLGAFEFTPFRALFLAIAFGAAVLAIIFEFIGAHSAEEILPAISLPVVMRVRKTASGQSRSSKPPQVKVAMRNSNKGAVVAILGGLLIGLSMYPFSISLGGQFGLGTYAGTVMFFTGAVAATLFVSFLLMNVPIHGGPTSFKNYLRGSLGRHLLGIFGGIFFAAGVLLITMMSTLKEEVRPDEMWTWAAALGAGLIAIFLGMTAWRELAAAPGSAMRSLLAGAVVLLIAIGAFAMAMNTPVPPPAPAAQLLQLHQS